MAYYFMVERKKGEYQPINISASIYFQTVQVYKKTCAYTLKEIDDFTMMFKDEQELKEHLISEQILPSILANKTLSSRYLIKGKYLKVEYDLLYQKDMEHIYDPARLINLVMRRYYDNEFVFIKKLANNFSKHKECSTTAPEVARLAEASIYQGTKHPSLEELDKNGNIMLVRMLKLIILKHYEKPDGTIEYKDEVNYRNLHDMIAFINHYDKKYKTETIEDNSLEEESNKETLTTQTIDTINISVKHKCRRKKRTYHLEGQISFDV